MEEQRRSVETLPQEMMLPSGSVEWDHKLTSPVRSYPPAMNAPRASINPISEYPVPGDPSYCRIVGDAGDIAGVELTVEYKLPDTPEQPVEPIPNPAILYVGAGIGYGPVLASEEQNGGRVLAYQKTHNWDELEQMQEIIPGDDCNAVEWIALHPSGRTLFALCCFWRFSKIKACEQQPGKLMVFSIDSKTGELTEQLTVSSGGHQPCHAQVSPDLRTLAVAHYLCGSITLWTLNAQDGSLQREAPRATLQLPNSNLSPHYWGGSTPAPLAEAAILGSHAGEPLAHGVCFSGCGKWLAVCDAGQAKVMIYETLLLGISRKAMVSTIECQYPRPRHCAFSTDGATLLVIHERSNLVSAHAFDSRLGNLSAESVAVASTLQDSRLLAGRMQAAAEILISGDLLFASNRAIARRQEGSMSAAGTDATVAVFDAKNLTLLQHLAAGEPGPMGDARHIIAMPESQGGGVLVGLQHSNRVLHWACQKGADAAPLELKASSSQIKAPLCLAVWQQQPHC